MIQRCDSINLDGMQKPLSEERGTYGHAQKMHASMTYMFGRLQGLGNMWWHESDVGGGVMVGNPSISTEVSSFMCSLRHHKPGECLNSHRWGGSLAQRLLKATYTIAFVYMLHFNEVLKIQAHDFGVFEKGVTLHLPFHKTHQNGDIKPFHLWAFPPHKAHIFPVRALSAWLSKSRIKSGYVFRKIASGDRMAEANTPMYLHVERHWALRKICEWGGWSAEFLNLTIVKYLISSNDDPVELREHFFNPDRPPTVKCPHCGRCCPCG
ncbi:DNA breaking-rejoining enzyme [Suillus variegatus]|nr:DNA breaking-rejoining enzyme [Suillus variegatus]